MLPKSLSPTAVTVFDLCEARFKAEKIDFMSSASGDAANLGTSCHGALEDFVASGEAQAGAPLAVLLDHFEKHYWSLFDDDRRLSEGKGMLEKWHKRQDWTDVKVISTEQKQFIDVPVVMPDGTDGTLRFNFIIDRLDEINGGDTIRVVDYKSNMVAFTYDQMRSKPQPTLYGMLAKLKFPNASIWVQFDFLRHDAIGVKMTDAEHRMAWEWLKRKAQQVIDSNGTLETPNAECMYCPRKNVCKSLETLAEGGALIGLTVDGDVDAIAERVVQLTGAAKAMSGLLDEAKELLSTRMQHEGVTEIETDRFDAVIKSNRRRSIDPPSAAAIAGPDVYAKYSSITLSKFEEMIGRESFSTDQAAALQNLIQWRHTGVTVKVTPKGPVSEDGE